MHRRTFLALTAAVAACGTASRAQGFAVIRTEAEWQAMLTDLEYAVMRQEATEPPFSSPLDKTYAEGTYLCRGCDLPLYPSATKYDSGTGWPSFWDSLPGAVGTKPDNTMLMRRTEVHCARCGSHLGHIFRDGPAPTGLRHCLNGVSLRFVAA